MLKRLSKVSGARLFSAGRPNALTVLTACSIQSRGMRTKIFLAQDMVWLAPVKHDYADVTQKQASQFAIKARSRTRVIRLARIDTPGGST
jgi:hypothetical protein